MNTCNLITPARKKNFYYVAPPAPYTKPAHLPHRLALTLALIVKSGAKGTSSLALVNEGLLHPSMYVSRLRAMGAIIETQCRSDTDRLGWTHKNVAHYTFKGITP